MTTKTAVLITLSTLLGVLMLLVAARQFHRERRLSRHGRETRATVTGKQLVSGDEDKYFVDYAFLHAGEKHVGRDRLAKDEWTALDPGDTVPILFLDAAPKVSRLVASDATVDFIGSLCAGACLAAGAAWLWAHAGK